MRDLVQQTVPYRSCTTADDASHIVIAANGISSLLQTAYPPRANMSDQPTCVVDSPMAAYLIPLDLSLCEYIRSHDVKDLPIANTCRRELSKL
jgi:hypothetical protein